MSYNEQRFLARVELATTRAKQILENHRAPRLAENVEHSYDDKYQLAEFLTNVSASSLLQMLEPLGFSQDRILLLKK